MSHLVHYDFNFPKLEGAALLDGTVNNRVNTKYLANPLCTPTFSSFFRTTLAITSALLLETRRLSTVQFSDYRHIACSWMVDKVS